MNQKALKHATVAGAVETVLTTRPCYLWGAIGHFNGGAGTFATTILRNIGVLASGIPAQAVMATNQSAVNGHGYSWRENFFGMYFANGLTVQNILAGSSVEFLFEEL